jgi:hypothetical protein
MSVQEPSVITQWRNTSRSCHVQSFRVTSATNGRVDFELDIQKDHTVKLPKTPLFYTISFFFLLTQI